MGMFFGPIAMLVAPLYYLFNGEFESLGGFYDLIFTEMIPMMFENFAGLFSGGSFPSVEFYF